MPLGGWGKGKRKRAGVLFEIPVGASAEKRARVS